MAQHARLSPSGAERWLACPGSVALSADQPDDAGRDADVGTAAHTLLHLGLTTGKPLQMWVDRELNGITVDVDMLFAVRKAKDYIDDRLAQMRSQTLVVGEVFSEQPVPIDHLTGEPQAQGTPDVVVLVGSLLDVFDYKHGRTPVEVVENWQLLMYASGALQKYDLAGDVLRIRLHILQPNTGKFEAWEISVSELRQYEAKVREGAAATYRSDAQLAPSEDACRWCKAKAVCTAADDHAREITAQSFDVLPVVPVNQLARAFAPADLGKRLSALDWLRKWCDAIEAEAYRRVMNGEPVPGFKLVAGKEGNREWQSEEAALAVCKLKHLSEDVTHTKKLFSPAQAEKLVKSGDLSPAAWAEFKALIVRAPGKPALVPEHDKRAALAITPVVDLLPDLETNNDLI